MDFDAILEEIGEFGKYQKTNYLLICLPVLFAAGYLKSFSMDDVTKIEEF